jgi:broad specificity phosphatase PhoE
LTNTVVGLLRHGQTDWNIDFRLQGIADIPLNATGVAQAEVAGQLIDSDDWDVLLTSPLSRAKATAEIVAKSAGFDLIHTEPLLLERSFGEAEGLLYEEWKAKYEDTNLVPGAETLEALETRASLLLDKLAVDFAGQRVLTVSHGALIRKLIRIVSNKTLPREGERLGNASLSVLVHSAGVWSIAEYAPATLQAIDNS